MRKFSLFGSVLATGLLLGSCAAEVDLEEAAAVVKPAIFEKANMYYSADSYTWLASRVTPYTGQDYYWGVNGHPLTQEAYNHNDQPNTPGSVGEASLLKQLNLIRELGANYYRIDVVTTSLGKVTDNISPNLIDQKLKRFERLLALADDIPGKVVKILPVLYLTGLDVVNDTDAQSYQKGFKVGKGFATSYGGVLDVYEIGNEEEIQDRAGGKILKPSDGSNPTADYDQPKMQKLASYYKGMIDGIKQADGGAKVIINNAGWLHYGFFDYMVNTTNPPVLFDCYGLHWYSNMGKLTNVNNGDGRNNLGNMIDIITSLTPKDIWITEINRHGGSFNANLSSPKFPDNNDINKEIEQSKWIQSYIKELDGLGNVRAFFLHELYDQPAFGNDTLASELGIYRNASSQKKPAFKTFKFFIEETNFGFNDYIYSLFKILKKQTPVSGDISQIATWSTTLRNTYNKPQTVSNLVKEIAYDTFIDELFVKLLGRNNSDASVRTFFVNRLKNGATREEIITDFCHGDEFWQLSGSTNAGFIDRLFLKMVGRLPINTVQNPERSTWIAKFNTKTKGAIIQEMFIYDPYVDKFVQDQYSDIHSRQVSSETEKVYWRNQIKGGLKQNDFIKTILCLNEVWEKSIIDGYNRRNAGNYTFE